MATSQTVKLNLDTREFDRGISRATAALGALVSAATIGKIVQVTARFQDLETTLGAVFGGAEKGAQAFKAVQDLSTRTQFSVEDLATTFVKLGSAGIQPTEELLRTFTDAAAVTTDQVGSLTAITDLFARTTAGGLGLEDLNRLADRGLPVFDILNEKLGLSRLEISKFGQSAEGAQKILGALQEGIQERFGGATANRLQNLSTLMSNFSIAVTNASANIGNAMTPALGAFIDRVTQAIVNSEGLTTAIGQALGAAINGAQFLFELAAQNLDLFAGAAAAAIVVIGARGLAGAVTKLRVAFNLLTAAMLRNPFGALAVAATFLIGKLAFDNGLGKTLAQVRAVVDLLGEKFATFAQFLRDKVAAVINKLKEAFLGFVQSAIDGFNAIAEFIPGLDKTTMSAEELTGVVVDLGKQGLEYVSGKADELKEALANAVPQEVKDGLKEITAEAKKAGEEYDSLTKTVKKTTEALNVPEIAAGGVKSPVAKQVTSDQLKKQADDLKKRFDQLKSSLFTEEQAEIASYNAKLKLLDEYYKGRTNFDKEYAKTREIIETQHQKKLAEISQAQTQKQLDIFRDGEFGKLDLSKLTNDQLMDFTKEAGLTVLSELSKQNRAAFNAMKAYNLAVAVMNTAQGVTRALALPFPFNLAVAGIVGAAGAVQIAAIAGQKYQGRKTGGSVSRNRPFIVGEDGPELFVPNRTGTVIPNNEMGGSKNVNVTFNIETIDSTGFDELLTERKSTITNIIRDAAFERGERSPV